MIHIPAGLALKDILAKHIEDKNALRILSQIIPIRYFLKKELELKLHPDKISIKTLASGIDFLGWVNFPDHRILRTTTKRRMFRNIKDKKGKPETVQSYFGLMSHGNSYKLKKEILFYCL